MIKAAILEAMAKAGCSTEQIIATVKADEEAQEARLAHRREKNRIYQQNHRARQQMSAHVSADDADLPFPEGSSPKPLSPNPIPTLPPSPPSGAHGSTLPSFRLEFDQEFWPMYPNKVGKPVAFKSWLRARRRAELDTIMGGLRAYVAKRDDRAWCNPSTWLNQDRWNDRPAQAAKERSIHDVIADRIRDEEARSHVIETSYERRDPAGVAEALPSFAFAEGDGRRPH